MKELLEVMARLRDPETGCPWDRDQTFETIAPYTIEEAYEVAETIANGDLDELRLELGDLLFQVVFYAQMAKEQGVFEFNDVVRAISDKMIRRHPHVFADVVIDSADEQHHAWERMKREERRDKAMHGVLDDVAHALPGLMRAQKLQKRAAKVGFDWDNRKEVVAKLHEELDELEQAGSDPDEIMEECGDLLFACVNLIRHHKIDAEEALRRANRKFEHRFRHIEQSLREQDKDIHEADLPTMDALWEQAKLQERQNSGTSSGHDTSDQGK